MNDWDAFRENPYQAPAEEDPLGPPQGAASGRRSTWPTVLGILSCIFGGGGILLTAFGLVLLLILPAFLSQAPASADANSLEAMHEIMKQQIPLTLFGGSLQILLLVTGIGLLRRRPWSRPAALVWSVSKILVSIGGTIWSIPLAREQARMMTEQNPDIPAEQFGSVMFVAQMVGAAFGLLWACALPVVFLIFLNRQKVKDEVANW